MSKKKRPIIFFDSFEEMRLYGQLYTLEMNAAERLSEMYRLNQWIPGYGTWRDSGITELHIAKPGESVNDFYRRINGDAPVSDAQSGTPTPGQKHPIDNG